MNFDYKRGFPVNPKAEPGSFEESVPYVDNGTGLISADRYYSKEWMQKEWDNMWTKVWLGTGFASDLEEVGDYYVWDFMTESFIIVLAAPGEIKAYYNVCPHRGNRIATNETGSVFDGFTCTFHHWEFNLDGTIKSVTDSETFRDGVLDGELDLTEVHCDSVAGLIFINMSENPGPLREQLGVLADHMEFCDLQNMKVVKESESEWGCNWKAAVDVFTEAYHVQAIHPEVLPSMDDYHLQWDLYDNGCSRFILRQNILGPRIDDHSKLTEDLKYNLKDVGIDPETFEGGPNDVAAAIVQKRREWGAKHGVDYSKIPDSAITSNYNYTLFPNMTVNLYYDRAIFLMFRPHPTDPEKVYFRLLFRILPTDDPEHSFPAYMGIPEDIDYTGKTRPARQYYEGPDPAFGGIIMRQDYDNIVPVQQGLQSRAYKGMRFSEQEQRLRHHTSEVERYVKGEK